MKRQAVVLVLCVSSTVFTAVGPGSASEKGEENKRVARHLDEYLDVKDFQNPMTLKEALGVIMETLARRGKDLPILVDAGAFKRQDPETANVYDTAIQFQPYPRRMRTSTVLQIILSKMEGADAAMLIRNGMVVITTRKEASLTHLLQGKVLAEFHNTPFAEAVEELSALTGASIVLDGRLADKLRTPVTASFQNDVNLKSALQMLADMSELKVVFLSSGIYVTHPFNAQNLERELRERKQVKR